MSIPGKWLEPNNITPARADSFLAAHPGAKAVWIGSKGGSEPKITVYGHGGRTAELHHAPAMTFSERLAELVSDWPAGGGADNTSNGGGDDANALARSILEA